MAVKARTEWVSHLSFFDDASLYQTWDYAGSVFPGQKAVRLAIRGNGGTVGLAQVRVVSLPGLSRGIAYVAWGPLWRRRGAPPDAGAFRTVMASLTQEFAVKRKHLLRVVPNLAAEDSDWAVPFLEEAGFRRVDTPKPYRTLFLNLNRPLKGVRSGFAQKWRNCLNGAERAGLDIRDGASDEDYAAFLTLYAEMIRRKDFDSGVDVSRWAKMQRALLEWEKLRIFTAWKDGRPLAAVLASFMGDTGRYLLGATVEEGLRTKASYALQWRVIERLVESGFRYYDLGGIDPQANPGVYHFKVGMGGREVTFVGAFEYCVSPVSKAVVFTGEGIRALARRWR